jgi:hypothetical protein
MPFSERLPNPCKQVEKDQYRMKYRKEVICKIQKPGTIHASIFIDE